MGLKFKNAKAHRLAKKLSELTGESITEAVTKALLERIERLGSTDEPRLAERLLVIGRNCATRLKNQTLSVDHGYLLYDERGLPKHS